MTFSFGELVWTLKDNGKLISLYKVFNCDCNTRVYELHSVFDDSIVFSLEEYMTKSIYIKEEDCK